MKACASQQQHNATLDTQLPDFQKPQQIYQNVTSCPTALPYLAPLASSSSSQRKNAIELVAATATAAVTAAKRARNTGRQVLLKIN
jgi:hypothetical protein